VPEYEAEPLAPVEAMPDTAAARKESDAMNSEPPPGAFAPEPDAFGPSRKTFKLPPHVGAPGVVSPNGSNPLSDAARAPIVHGPSAPGSNAASPAAVDEDPNEAQSDPFESDEPAPEEWQGDRRDARSRELAVPDDYLDPGWPEDDADSHVAPEESDSVENVPLGDDQEMDAAEREETARYKEALGLNGKSDEFKQDDWGDTSADRTRERDVKEYEDPAEW
jgi:hypothetical protein